MLCYVYLYFQLSFLHNNHYRKYTYRSIKPILPRLVGGGLCRDFESLTIFDFIGTSWDRGVHFSMQFIINSNQYYSRKVTYHLASKATSAKHKTWELCIAHPAIRSQFYLCQHSSHVIKPKTTSCLLQPWFLCRDSTSITDSTCESAPPLRNCTSFFFILLVEVLLL